MSAEEPAPKSSEVEIPEDKTKGISGDDLVRFCMKRQGLKGNPKDYVVMHGFRWIQDGARTLEVNATLPAVLEVGNHVWTFNKKGDLRAVQVVRDEGAELWVSNGLSEFKIERAEALPTALPRKPTAVHKSQIRLILGDGWGRQFWRPGIGRRNRKRT